MWNRTYFAALLLTSSSALVQAPADAGKRQLVDQSYLAMSTLNDLRSVRLALREYLIDHGALPPGTTIEAVPGLIAPMYIRTAIVVDAWHTLFRIRVAPDGKTFSIASAGSDVKFDESTWAQPGLLSRSAEDAVLSSDPAADREWVIQE